MAEERVRIEMHCHSLRSDGSLEPAEVARRAGAQGCRLFCLTDHDTWAGFAEAERAVPDMPQLRSAELSCSAAGRTVHLLCYGIQDGDGAQALSDRLQEVVEKRRARIVSLCERLAALGVHIDPEPILQQTQLHGASPGRPHVAAAMVEAGVVPNMRQAFDRFLKDDGPAFVPTAKLEVGDAVRLATDAGARVSLAHPHTLGDNVRVEALFVEHRDAGLSGIEGLYGRYGAAERRNYAALARRFDLVLTGGSDFHGAAVPTVTDHGVDVTGEQYEAITRWLAPLL